MRYEEKDFTLAKRFCGIVLGTDVFYRNMQMGESGEESFTSEGLVPVDFSGVAPSKITSWQQACSELEEILHEYEKLEDPVRRNYMLQQTGSFRKVCLWLSGFPMTFREIAAETMFINENPVGERFLQDMTKRLGETLKEAGYEGNVEEQLKAWRKARAIDGPEKTLETLEALLKEAKDKTLALGFEAIRDFDVHAKLVYNVPYNAYCDYMSRMIYINGEVSYTYDELKHLVCHEAYPGHMTHMAVRQQLVETGKIPADAGLVLTNTASSPVFEGLADNGMDVLGWSGDINDKICKLLDQIQAICNQNASHIYYCEEDGREKAKRYMEERSFSSEMKISSRLRYMGYPFRKAYMYAYWRGWEAVEKAWGRLPEEKRADFLTYLYENMYSVDTVLQFEE